MSEGVQGAWPGGPGRKAGDGQATHAPHIPSVGEFYDARDRGSAIHRSRRTRRRFGLILVLAAVVAGGGGWALGRAASADSAQVTRDLEAPNRYGDPLKGEVDRVLADLWQMEILQTLH